MFSLMKSSKTRAVPNVLRLGPRIGGPISPCPSLAWQTAQMVAKTPSPLEASSPQVVLVVVVGGGVVVVGGGVVVVGGGVVVVGGGVVVVGESVGVKLGVGVVVVAGGDVVVVPEALQDKTNGTVNSTRPTSTSRIIADFVIGAFIFTANSPNT